jgi:peptide-methionine (S)-S-oxide reductase
VKSPSILFIVVAGIAVLFVALNYRGSRNPLANATNKAGGGTRIASPSKGKSSRTIIKESGQRMKTETAILAGGCFWGVQELIRNKPGVVATEVGYSGGDVPNATYMNHGSHAEAVKVVFEPERLTYRELLEFFFQLHDPTTLNRQGNDMGASYRSAIFYATDEQKRTAEALIKEIEASKKWPGAIVTEVKPASAFWSAEAEHQDYLQKNPGGYTCHWVRPDWTLKD